MNLQRGIDQVIYRDIRRARFSVIQVYEFNNTEHQIHCPNLEGAFAWWCMLYGQVSNTEIRILRSICDMIQILPSSNLQ